MKARQPFWYVLACAFACLSPLNAQTVSITSSPQTLTVFPGEGAVPITVTVAGSAVDPVNVTLAGLPSGITVSPTALSLTPGTSGIFTLNVGVHADQEAFLTNSPAAANTATNTISLLGISGSTRVSGSLSLTVSLTNPGFSPQPAQITLPIVNINTNGTPIVDKTTDIPGTITINSADGSTSYLPNSTDSDDTAAFHLHGTSTILMPKKAYHVKLTTSLDLLTQMGLSCPYTTGKKPVCDKSKSYILLANYDDKTLLRDWSASALANSIPYGGDYLNETALPNGSTGTIPTPSGTAALMPWAPHSLFVELFINGAYEGLYQLIEQIKVDSHRLNIPELSETDTSGDLSGGYLLEIDQHKDEAFIFTTPHGLPIGLIDPDFTPDPEAPQQTDYISQYVDTAENALFASNFTDPVLGWRAYFDEASAVNFYLVNDIMGNVDGGDFYSSDYLYKTIDDPFLYMGPVWDFDISSGNVNSAVVVNPTAPWMQSQALWYRQWFKDPGFKADVTTQFNALKKNGVLSGWIVSIAQQAATLKQAQSNNFARWPMLGIMVYPNSEAGDTYDQEVAYLTNYLQLRIAYLDSLLNGKLPTSTTLSAPTGTLHTGTPKTLSAHVTSSQAASGTVSFLSSGVLLGTATLGASQSASLSVNLPAGSDSLTAVYSGDTVNALSSSSAIAVTVNPPAASSSTTLTTSTSTVSPGGSVKLSAYVTSNAGSHVPTGLVTFTWNGSTVLGSASLGANGATGITTSALPAGTGTVQAKYAGDTLTLASSSNTATLSVTQKTVSVTFSTNLPGLTYQVDGVSYNTAQSLTFTSGSKHVLSTDSPQTNGGAQLNFASWSDGGAISHSITISGSATSYLATFSRGATSVADSGGFSAGGLVLNGSAALSGTRLRLTDGKLNEAASAFYPQLLNVQAFTTDFDFQLSNAQADGFMFVLQSQATTALGASGGNLGFGGMANSAGVKFDFFSNAGEGNDSTGLYTNGADPATPAIDLTPSGVVLAKGNLMHAHITYDGTTLLETLTDSVSGATVTESYPINLTSVLGSGAAYVGFTAGTGGLSATQDIVNWTYGAGLPTTSSPTFAPAAGTYSTIQVVRLSAATTGAKIYYTIDGTTPTIASTLYAGPFTLSSTTMVRAIAVFDGVVSPISSARYTLVTSQAVSDGNGITASSVVLNGAATLSATKLRLTDGKENEAASAFYPVPLNVQSFTTNFNFQLTDAQADGFMFVIQNSGVNALGNTGGNLGFAGIPKSVGVKFDFFSNAGEGSDSTGLYINGVDPATPSIDITPTGVVLASGHVMHVHITYDGATLVESVTDTATGSTVTEHYSVNISAVVGSGTAFVGFTAGTGGLSAIQDILQWTYTPAAPAVPVISPGAGHYATAQQLSLSDATTGARIYYTLDGTPPTVSSTLYSGPITISSSATLKALAAFNGVVSSAATATYVIP